MFNANRIEQTMTVSYKEIATQEVFKDIEAQLLFPYLADCEIRVLNKNDLLIRAGEVNECLFLILEGSCRVQLRLDQEHSVAKLNAGQCIGEIAFIDHQPATAFVVADSDTRILVIDEKLLWKLSRVFHPLACNLLEMIAHRLRHSNSVINQIKDMVTRFGGEEFFAILPGMDKEAAKIIANRLCEAVASTEIIQQTNSLLTPITVSIGIAEMLNKDDVETLIYNADKALYKAKELGRNRVSH